MTKDNGSQIPRPHSWVCLAIRFGQHEQNVSRDLWAQPRAIKPAKQHALESSH